MGQDPEAFWRLTLREIDLIMRGCTNRAKREHNDRAWHAWHTAFLTAYAPQKSREFVKLKKLQAKDAASQQEQVPDWRAQLAKVQAWVSRGK